MVIDEQAMRMARTRELHAKDPMARRRAVCGFPLMAANVAKDMLKLLGMVEQHGMTPGADEALTQMENQIRAAYRELFGAELGDFQSGASHD